MQLKSFQFIDWNLFIYFLSTLGTKSISMTILDRVSFQLKVIFGHTRRPFAEKVPLTQCSKKVTPAYRKSFTLHPSGFNFTRNLIRLPRMASHQGVGGRLLQLDASDKVFLAIKKKTDLEFWWRCWCCSRSALSRKQKKSQTWRIIFHF